MKMIDYIFLNLYYYYSGDSYKLKWTTPQSWTIYVMAMGSLIWGFVIKVLLDKFIFHLETPVIICVAVAALFYGFLHLRYLKSNNYEKLSENSDINKDSVKGKIISFVSLIAIPLIVFVAFIFFRKEMKVY